MHAVNNSITCIYIAFTIIGYVCLLWSVLLMMNEDYHICYYGWKVHTLTNKVIFNENTLSLWCINTLNLEMIIIKTWKEWNSNGIFSHDNLFWKTVNIWEF